MRVKEIIAEFMEVEIMYSEEWKAYFYEYLDGDNMRTYYLNEWNGIMPIVEKILDRWNQDTYFNEGHLYDEIVDSLQDVDKEATFKACVEFAKWYKENK